MADLKRMAAYRYGRLQSELVKNDCVGAVLLNSVSIRYATGIGYAQIANLRAPIRMVYVPAKGKAVIYDWEMYSFDERPDFIGEYRDAILSAYFIAGDAHRSQIDKLAKALLGLIAGDGARVRLAIDAAVPELVQALAANGIELMSAQKLVQRAGSVKSADEVACIENAIAVAERGLSAIRDNLADGISECELWAHLAHENARSGGEWFDYRILSSGIRTNPWGQEVSDKIIRSGEIVTVDTGMVGPQGYGADISRTFVCPPAEPTPEQCRLYQTALENLQFNIDLITPGLSFYEFAEQSWPVPEEFWARRYNSIAHGVGMGNEWPLIPFIADWIDGQADGVFEPGMVFAVESCIGCEDGGECVKLEDMVLVEEHGNRVLSGFPFEENLGKTA